MILAAVQQVASRFSTLSHRPTNLDPDYLLYYPSISSRRGSKSQTRNAHHGLALAADLHDCFALLAAID